MSDYVGNITAHPKTQTDRSNGGVPVNRWNITLAGLLVFCDPSFARIPTPETKSQNWLLLCLIHWMRIPGYCISRGIKLQKVFIFFQFYSKHSPKRPVNRHFQAKLAYTESRISSKLRSWFQPNFAQQLRYDHQMLFTVHGWPKHTHKCKMADGRHFQNLGNGSTDCHEIWHAGLLHLWTASAIKISDF